MITAIVSAIEGPILSVISGCLGESGMQRLWLWNLVPTQVNMLGSDVSRTAEHLMVRLNKVSLIVQEIYAEHSLGAEAQNSYFLKVVSSRA